MLIKSVELKNVKSYTHETIEFLPGINGICGQNGHGKTTILEAIGYVLFDYPPYKKIDDFRRHGEKSGYAAVTIEGKDEIEYTIQRKLGGSDYFIRTPVSEIRGKKDVTDWIASNFLSNIRSPEDIPSIFENAVGVPQGTFTTAFLLNPEPRKKIFDNILRVEEYNTAYRNLRDVTAAIEKTIDSLEKDLIPLRTRTERYLELKKEKESLQTEIDALKAEIKEINIKITSLTKKKEELSGKKAQLDTLSSQIANERIRLEGITKQLEKAKSDFQNAEAAQKTVNELLPVEDMFKKENLALKELNVSRAKRDKLKEDIAKLDFKISTLLEKLERSSKLSQENNELEEKKNQLVPKIEAAHELEDKIKDLKDNLEIPLRELSSEIIALKEKERRAEGLRNEISALVSEKNNLSSAVETHKALEDKIKSLSDLLESLRKLGSELKQAVEKEKRANALSLEIEQIENNMLALAPPIEQQKALEMLQHELNQQQAAVGSLLKQTRSNMKLAGTQGLCPILNGIKCASVSDFTQYFKNEIDTKKKELKEIERKLEAISKELKQLNNPAKQCDGMKVLVEAKKKEAITYAGVREEVNLSRSRIEALASAYPEFTILTGDEEEQKAVSLKLKSLKNEFEKIQKSVSEFESKEALIESKNRDLEKLSDIPAELAECGERIKKLNSRFGLDIEIDSVKDHLENTVLEIKSLDASLKELKFFEKEFEKLKAIIEKNLKEIKTLEHVPGLLDSCRRERDELVSRSLIFEGLDEKIVAVQDNISRLEPEHNRYLQAKTIASRIDEYALECKKLKELIATTSALLDEYISRQKELLEEFSESLLNDTVSQLEELGKTASSKMEAVKGKNKNLDKLAREIVGMESELIKIKEIGEKLENEKQFLSFSNFIRDTIKNSSEYIVNEFISEISQEACNIYCEIMDDYTCELKWQNDYDIEIESGGEAKSFRQLSGGERMGAALAVRLALLKALSSCDFVFLDEPTQNMDEIRREKLSQEIMKIHGFKQIFVISHDDTFNEKYGHVVKIEKINGESRVVHD